MVLGVNNNNVWTIIFTRFEWSWPSSVTDEPQKVVDGKNIIGIASSYGTMYAFDATGKMWNAGNNWEGQIGDGTTTGVVRVKPLRK
jgi:alpha-tubulin suppressor-like RCC1 family protein